MSYNEFRSIAGADNRIGLEEFITYERSKYPYRDPYEVRRNAEQKFYLMDRDGSGRIEYNEYFYDSPAQIYQAYTY